MRKAIVCGGGVGGLSAAIALSRTGWAVELFEQSNQARHAPVAPLGRALSAYIDDALRSGVRVALCSTAMRDRALAPADMIPEATEVIGMVSMLELALDPTCKVLVY